MPIVALALHLILILGDDSAKSPPKAEVEKLVEKYFDAPRDEQIQIEARLDLLPPLAPKEEATWRTRLFQRAKKGRKAALEGTNYFFDEKKKLGKYLANDSKSETLVIAMHGGGAGSGDAESAAGGFSGPLAKIGAVAIFPEVLRKTEHGWGEDDTERFVIDLIEAVKRTRKIDPNRIYLTGHSMGGYGTYTIGAHHADMFGGLAAFAGAPTPYFDERRPGQKVLYGIEDGVLPNLRNVPLSFYQSRDDQNVTAEVNVWLSTRFPELQAKFGGYETRCEIVDGRGHAFPEAGPLPALEWAVSHVRAPAPVRVLWQPTRSWKRMFYWLWWEDPILGETLDVTANREKNEIAVTAPKDWKKLSLFVDDRIVDTRQEITVRINGDARFHIKPEARLSTLLRTIATRNDPGLAFSMRLDLF